MQRRMLLGCSFLALAAPARAEAPWLLVTPEEALLGREAPPMPKTRGITPSRPPGARETPGAGAPEIVVEQPGTATPLHPPLSFRVLFMPEAGATVDPRSFRATYGAMGLDITGRLLQHARLSAQMLAAENVDIPRGTHTVTLSIADTMGRMGKRTFSFMIA